MTGTKWLIVAVLAIVGVGILTFITTNPVELVLAAILFGLVAWQGLRVRAGKTK